MPDAQVAWIPADVGQRAPEHDSGRAKGKLRLARFDENAYGIGVTHPPSGLRTCQVESFCSPTTFRR